jgi:hypothetical protein
MGRRSVVAWSLVGLLSAALGWVAGGLIGGLLARTLLAGVLTAAGLGLLSRRPLLGGGAALAAALAGAGGWFLGLRLASPLLAWPVIALVVGAAGALVLTRRAARVAAVIGAPVLGTLGFVAGVAVVACAGFATDDARVLGALLGGGAAGFGLGTLGWLRLTARWFEREAVREGGAS